MTPEFAYFLKVNVAFALFYAFYRLFFYKDTFFKLRRTTLLAFFGLAILYPLFNIQEWVREQEPIAEVIFYYSLIITPSVDAPVESAAINWPDILRKGLWAVYFAGITLLTVRFISQFGSIVWLTRSSETKVIQGVKVFALNKPAGPFSFFQWIFLHPESHTKEETEEILTHECTHAGQWHSIDVIVSEIISIICWFNPFVWLLKREVRHNLEYLADNTVLESGYDSRSYQYHLLGLAHHHKEPTHLYNSFNVLHLKNRISMMNKKRSHSIGRTKYLLFIPLVIALMIVSNMEAVARITKNVAREITPPFIQTLMDIPYQDITEEETLPFAPIEIATPPSPPPLSNSGEVITEDTNNHVFTIVEKMPKFPGGDNALLKHINSELVFPADAAENGAHGRVIVTFVVTKNGSVQDASVMRSIYPSLDAEALRVINALPKWEPGEQRGQPVNVKYTVPIQFNHPDESSENHTFTVVEKMPKFPEGEHALLKHISSQIKYPVIAQENGIQGRVVVSMVIDTDGNVVDPEIVRGVDPSLDTEALRVVNSLPKWEPGEQRGKKVRVKYTLPVQFRLQ